MWVVNLEIVCFEHHESWNGNVRLFIRSHSKFHIFSSEPNENHVKMANFSLNSPNLLAKLENIPKNEPKMYISSKNS